MFHIIGRAIDDKTVGDILRALAFHAASVITQNGANPALVVAIGKAEFLHDLDSAIDHIRSNPTPSGPAN